MMLGSRNGKFEGCPECGNKSFIGKPTNIPRYEVKNGLLNYMSDSVIVEEIVCEKCGWKVPSNIKIN